jgi:type I restriction enzyme R subunit
MTLQPLNDLDEQVKNEENTKLMYITPAIQKKWCSEGDSIVMEYSKDKRGNKISGHYFTAGQILVTDKNIKRGERKKVDYLLLFRHNIPLALVEAKGYDHDINEGIQQSLEYGEMLNVPYCYASNGQMFHEENRLTGSRCDFGMDDFPTSDKLWERYIQDKGLSEEQADLVITPYYSNDERKKPRYYQRNAINRAIEAIAKGQNRLLIVMATGTGKTYVAMQIIYRLYMKGIKKKILFLVDRTALAEQTFDAFTPFKKSMVRIGEKYTLKNKEDIKKLSAYEVYISLYHQMKSGKSDEEELTEEDNSKTYYKNLPPDFFDLIVVDECHRGSLREESSWHEMLDYFSPATQIGLTATPKETAFGSNIGYFCKDNNGEPIYTYSLQQGIKDGFLAPYKVVAVELDVDRDGYRPKAGELDIFGKPLEDRLYEQREFDRKLIIDGRRKLVAKQISDYIKSTGDRYTKTIVFCETEEHAGAMTNYLKDENQDMVKLDFRYVMRITSNDKAGKDQIKNFAAPSQKYPVIAVTSKLLSTGIDTQTVGVIVLDKTIGSMSEFKQTIGRGTRIKEEYKVDNEEKSKMHFTIIDFRKNYLKFDDPDFDGDVEVTRGNSIPCAIPSSKSKTKREIFRIKGENIELVGKTVKYLDEDMKLIKEENVVACVENNIRENYPNFEAFRDAWKKAEDKPTFAMELLLHQRFVDKFREELGFNVDFFDMIAFVGYGITIPTKQDRINRTVDYVFTLTTEQQKVVKLLLECYKQSDFNDLRLLKIFDLPIFAQKGYSRKTAIKPFGGKDNYMKIVDELEKIMY